MYLKPNRENYWDFLKGIGILFVFYIHSVGGWNYVAWTFYLPRNSILFNSYFIILCFTTFVVPLFFFISGYLTIEEKLSPFSSYLKKRFNRVLVPYFIWSGIYSLVNKFVYHYDVDFWSFISGSNGIQLYFLAVCIQLAIIVVIFPKLKYKKILFAICMIITIADNLIQMNYVSKTFELLPNHMILFTSWIGFFYMGFYFRNYSNIQKLNTRMFRIISGAILVFAFGGNVLYSYHVLNFANNLPAAGSFNTIPNFIYSIAVILFSLSVKDLYKSNRFVICIEWIGKNSIDFFALHWLIMSPLKEYFILNCPNKYFWLYHFATSFCSLIICTGFVLLKKIVLKLFAPSV